MKKLYVFSLLACVLFIHSAKLQTNQRPQSTQTSNTSCTPTSSKNFRKRKNKSLQDQTLFSSPNTHTPLHNPYQPLFANKLNTQQKRINLFVNKIDFSREGVSLFLHHTFNNKEYATEFLPYSLSHLGQFLEFAHGQNQSLEFIEGALRLFNQKYKNSPFITAPALERFLDKASPFFEERLTASNYSMWHSFKDTLSQTFKEKFSLAKQDPLGFFEYVSKDLASQVTLNLTTPTRVRSTLFRFLTNSTDKVIWSAQDQELSWYSFKKLGNSFYALHVAQVIPDELDANELYWSLIERYCHFLKLSGNQLTLDTCKAIKRDLLESPLTWLRHKEQEAVLESKMERLMSALLETEAKIYANQQGIVTDTLPHQRTA